MFAWLVCLHKKCFFYTYLFVLEVQTNLVLQQKHNRHTHSANLDAAMTSGGSKQQETEKFRIAGNTRNVAFVICHRIFLVDVHLALAKPGENLTFPTFEIYASIHCVPLWLEIDFESGN